MPRKPPKPSNLYEAAFSNPDELKTERVQLLMTPSEVERIDEWGFKNRIRTRAEAIRRLVQFGFLLNPVYGLASEGAFLHAVRDRGEMFKEEERQTQYRRYIEEVRSVGALMRALAKEIHQEWEQAFKGPEPISLNPDDANERTLARAHIDEMIEEMKSAAGRDLSREEAIARLQEILAAESKPTGDETQ